MCIYIDLYRNICLPALSARGLRSQALARYDQAVALVSVGAFLEFSQCASSPLLWSRQAVLEATSVQIIDHTAPKPKSQKDLPG